MAPYDVAGGGSNFCQALPCESPPTKAFLQRSGLVHTTPEVVAFVNSRVPSGLQYPYPWLASTSVGRAGQTFYATSDDASYIDLHLLG